MPGLDLSQLSSNWKKLQGQLHPGKTENASRGVKRKHPSDQAATSTKKAKLTVSDTQPQKKHRRTRMPSTSGGSVNMSPNNEKAPALLTGLNHVFINHDEAQRTPIQGQPSPKVKSAKQARYENLSRSPSPTQGPRSQARRTEVTPDDGISQPSPSRQTTQGESINSGLLPTHIIGKYIALDCEMVGTGPPPHSDHVLARVSAVNYHGDQIYDAYVLPPPGIKVTDYRTWVSGITPRHLQPGFARPFKEVRSDVAALLQGKVLVGHALRNDLQVLQLSHPRRDMRDTAQYPKFRKGSFGSPALRHLATVFLGLEIQTGEHSSLEDARATMSLFRQERPGFEAEVRKRYREPDRQNEAVAKADRKPGTVKSITEALTATAKRNGSYAPSNPETWEDSELEANGLEPVNKVTKKRKKKKRTKRK